MLWVCSAFICSLGASIPEAANQSQPEPAAAEPEQAASEPEPEKMDAEPEKVDAEPQV